MAPTGSKSAAALLARLAHALRETLVGLPGRGADRRRLQAFHAAVQEGWNFELSQPQLIDACAQALACGQVAVRVQQGRLGRNRVAHWLLAQSDPFCREVLTVIFSAAGLHAGPPPRWLPGPALARLLNSPQMDAVAGPLQTASPANHALLHLYEHFLHLYDGGRRTRHGVFYTPGPVAAFIVHQADHLLRAEFHLDDGLAATVTWQQMAQRSGTGRIPAGTRGDEPFVRILDPAAGTGVFLLEVIERIWVSLTSRWCSQGLGGQEIRRRWNDYVPEHLLPRLWALELMPPAAVLAQLQLAAKLAETGYQFDAPAPVHLRLADTLAQPGPCRPAASNGTDSLPLPFTVVLGNPPFSGISNNRSVWIDELLRGRDPDGRKAANYYEVDGRPLGERKLWLQDDYVKFLRYAQWQTERAGCGLVGLVTNHGYLDNTTFCGLRQQLLRHFPRITVVDLHGNYKKKERPPDGGRDQSVFPIEQGVAIGLLRRPPDGGPGGVFHAELWGDRKQKLLRLQQAAGHPQPAVDLPLTRLQPASPYYVLVPRDRAIQQEYQRGWKLTDIMPVNTTAPVTARDRLVVALDRQELLDRLAAFRDLTIPDAEIRRRFFPSSRSANYPPGDTRGWKLHQARRRMAAEPDWQRAVQSCLYRPFDHRPVYWADWMIDWPRSGVVRHLAAGPNLALIARRQMLPSQPCTYFWVSREVALDGVIRSDNRGSESLFPLYLYCSAPQPQHGPTPPRACNFAPAFIDAVQRTLSLRWQPDGSGDLRQSLGPEDLAQYLYALFHSPTYRRRYAEQLRVDFPRVLLPRQRELFAELVPLGGQLMTAHAQLPARPDEPLPLPCLLQQKGQGPSEQIFRWPQADGIGRIVQRGYPKFQDGNVYLSATACFEDVPPEVWGFRVGGHQVCKKWLQDRRGRRFSATDIAHYGRILVAVQQTLGWMAQIDRRIECYGRWPGAFDGCL